MSNTTKTLTIVDLNRFEVIRGTGKLRIKESVGDWEICTPEYKLRGHWSEGAQAAPEADKDGIVSFAVVVEYQGSTLRRCKIHKVPTPAVYFYEDNGASAFNPGGTKPKVTGPKGVNTTAADIRTAVEGAEAEVIADRAEAKARREAKATRKADAAARKLATQAARAKLAPPKRVAKVSGKATPKAKAAPKAKAKAKAKAPRKAKAPKVPAGIAKLVMNTDGPGF